MATDTDGQRQGGDEDMTAKLKAASGELAAGTRWRDEPTTSLRILPRPAENCKPPFNHALSQLLDQAVYRCENGGGWRDWAIRFELEGLIP